MEHIHFMNSSRDTQKARAIQVGFVQRAYRESFVHEDGRRGLTQDELLRRMAEVDASYAERYSHTTVSRWESGVTRPSIQRLRVFGRALGLSQVDVAGLIAMAGLTVKKETTGGPGNFQDAQVPESLGLGDRLAEVRLTGLPILRESYRFLLVRVLPLAACITGLGFAFSILGYNGPNMPAAYVAIATALVLGQGLVFGDPKAGLREFYWATVFFLLSTPILQFAPLGMDHYSLYKLAGVSGTYWTYMLALLINLGLASFVGLSFHLLWLWQNTGHRADQGSYARASKAVLPPLVAVYAVLLVLSNASIWIQYAVLLPAVAGVFTALMILRDPSTRPSESDQKLLVVGSLTLAVILGLAGIAVVFSIYISPDFPRVLPDHNLLRSWELDFDQLGFTRQEAFDMLNLGYLWHGICVFVYMGVYVPACFLLAVFQIGRREHVITASRPLGWRRRSARRTLRQPDGYGLIEWPLRSSFDSCRPGPAPDPAPAAMNRRRCSGPRPGQTPGIERVLIPSH